MACLRRLEYLAQIGRRRVRGREPVLKARQALAGRHYLHGGYGGHLCGSCPRSFGLLLQVGCFVLRAQRVGQPGEGHHGHGDSDQAVGAQPDVQAMRQAAPRVEGDIEIAHWALQRA